MAKNAGFILKNVSSGDKKNRECFMAAVGLFEECQSEVFLKQAREALKSCG
ncbi:hypothetical protein ACFLZG_01795 [Thermodesulfobacteriota bacterium]